MGASRQGSKTVIEPDFELQPIEDEDERVDQIREPDFELGGVEDLGVTPEEPPEKHPDIGSPQFWKNIKDFPKQAFNLQVRELEPGENKEYEDLKLTYETGFDLISGHTGKLVDSVKEKGVVPTFQDLTGITNTEQFLKKSLDLATTEFIHRKPINYEGVEGDFGKWMQRERFTVLHNTFAAVLEFPFIIPKLIFGISRRTIGDPIGRAIGKDQVREEFRETVEENINKTEANRIKQGKEPFTEEQKNNARWKLALGEDIATSVTEEAKAFGNMLKMWLPVRIDEGKLAWDWERWANDMFESPDLMVFGFDMLRRLLRGGIRKGTGVTKEMANGFKITIEDYKINKRTDPRPYKEKAKDKWKYVTVLEKTYEAEIAKGVDETRAGMIAEKKAGEAVPPFKMEEPPLTPQESAQVKAMPTPEGKTVGEKLAESRAEAEPTGATMEKMGIEEAIKEGKRVVEEAPIEREIVKEILNAPEKVAERKAVSKTKENVEVTSLADGTKVFKTPEGRFVTAEGLEVEGQKLPIKKETPVTGKQETPRQKKSREASEKQAKVLKKATKDFLDTAKEVKAKKVPAPKGFAEGARVKFPKMPQDYTIEKVLKSSKEEQALGEQYFEVKNNKTGEVDVVEKSDIRLIKAPVIAKAKPKLKVKIKKPITPIAPRALGFKGFVESKGLVWEEFSKSKFESPEYQKVFQQYQGEAPTPSARGVLGNEAGFIRLPKFGRTKAEKKLASERGARIKDLVFKRSVDIDRLTFESELFISKFESKFSKAEREALPFLIEKIKDPDVLKKIGRDDLTYILKNPSPELLRASEKMGKYLDEGFDFLKEEYSELKFVEDYVTHLWDVERNRKGELVSYFATNNPFTKKRKVPSLEAGIEKGLTPKELDMATILRIYDQHKIKAVHNARFADAISKFRDENNELMIQPISKAPANWKTIDHPAINKAVWTKGTKDIAVISKNPVKVHPDIAADVLVVLERPFSGRAIKAVETINAFVKKSQLSASFFHHFALTEAALSTGIPIEKLVKLWDPRKMYNAIKNKDYDIFRNAEITRDSIEKGGVRYGSLPDVQIHKVRQALLWAERQTKDVRGLKHGTKGLRKFNDLWDAALWDYYHNSLKLYAYEHNLVKALNWAEKSVLKKEGRALNMTEIDAIKKDIGSFVNDSFGGQRWDMHKFLGNPKVQQIFHWSFLAPDWTISTLRQAIAPVRGAKDYMKSFRERDPAKASVQRLKGGATARRGFAFWTKAAMYFTVVANAINYFNTEKDYGEGRMIWDNIEGHKLNIYWGHNEDGTERYIRAGKQFRDVLEIANPQTTLKKIGSKLSPIAGELGRQAFGHSLGNPYPAPWLESDTLMENIWLRAKSIAEIPLPFTLQSLVNDRPTQFMLALPSSRGLTKHSAQKLFKQRYETLLKKQNQMKAEGKSDKEIREWFETSKHRRELLKVFISALENNLDAPTMSELAQKEVASDISFDNKQVAKEVFKELQGLNYIERESLVAKYIERGIVTKDIFKKLNTMLETEGKVDRMQDIVLPELRRQLKELKK